MALAPVPTRPPPSGKLSPLPQPPPPFRIGADALGRGDVGSSRRADRQLLLCLRAEEPDAHAIVAAWSERAGVDADEMTVNVVHAGQGGKRYAVMAWLYLPSLWSEEDVAALGEGLAAALADVADVQPSAVQVLTSIVTSGSVVEAGETLRW